MFEYLMPLLVMPTFEHTLLDQTYRAAVARQIEYGQQRGVPWGISESGYNAFDASLNYQYRAFGVPGLGFKRGLGGRPGDRAVCVDTGADGGAGRGVRQPAAAGGRGLPGALRLLRSDRLHAGAPAARQAVCADPVVDGAPSGHESAGAWLSAAGSPDAATLCIGPAVSGHGPAVARTNPENHGLYSNTHRTGRSSAPPPPATWKCRCGF